MRRYVTMQRLYFKGSEAMLATLAEARRLVEARAGRPAAAQSPSRLPPGAAAEAAAGAAVEGRQGEQALEGAAPAEERQGEQSAVAALDEPVAAAAAAQAP